LRAAIGGVRVALIPTANGGSFPEALARLERAVFDMVVGRFRLVTENGVEDVAIMMVEADRLQRTPGN
jgi:hypothetical protein